MEPAAAARARSCRHGVVALPTRRPRVLSPGTPAASAAATALRCCVLPPPTAHPATAVRPRANSPGAEHVAALTAQHPPDQPAAVPGPPDDLLDGHAGPGLFQHHGIGVLSPQVALVLDAFGRGEQRRVQGRGADRLADGGWRMADGGWRMADGGWRASTAAPPPRIPCWSSPSSASGRRPAPHEAMPAPRPARSCRSGPAPRSRPGARPPAMPRRCRPHDPVAVRPHADARDRKPASRSAGSGAKPSCRSR